MMAGETLHATVINMRFIKPLDTDLVRETVAEIGNRAAFSANLRTIRTADEMLGELLDSVG